jgi:peptide/nickel transport system permease protein
VELAFPFIVLALGVIAALGPNVRNLIIVLGVVGWPVYARVIRAQTLSLREREFITAAQVSGMPVRRILFRHLLPNVADSILVLATLQVATFILVEAFLSYLGLGIRPPLPSWGGMLNDGRQVMLTSPWVSTFPGLAIFATTICINLVADAVRDYLDPLLPNE